MLRCCYLLVAVDEDDAECGGDKAPTRAYGHVVALADVVYVDGYGRVCADAVLLHQRDQLRLRQQIRRARLALHQFCLMASQISAQHILGLLYSVLSSCQYFSKLHLFYLCLFLTYFDLFYKMIFSAVVF